MRRHGTVKPVWDTETGIQPRTASHKYRLPVGAPPEPEWDRLQATGYGGEAAVQGGGRPHSKSVRVGAATPVGPTQMGLDQAALPSAWNTRT